MINSQEILSFLSFQVLDILVRQCSSITSAMKRGGGHLLIRASNRIFFHFPVSKGYNRVNNRIANVVKIIG